MQEVGPGEDDCAKNAQEILYAYSATKLKRTTKKSKILTKAIDCNTWLPFDQAWSRASKKVHVLQSIA